MSRFSYLILYFLFLVLVLGYGVERLTMIGRSIVNVVKKL